MVIGRNIGRPLEAVSDKCEIAISPLRDFCGATRVNNSNRDSISFDLGVSQFFELRSAASEIEGINEVKIRLTRRSGQPKDWKRLNKVLLDDLRKQFLIWRSVPTETMEHYRQITLAVMGMKED